MGTRRPDSADRATRRPRSLSVQRRVRQFVANNVLEWTDLGRAPRAEARPLFAWIPHLRAIGWTSEQIQSLPERIAQGEYSLQNLLRDARKMQDAGVVKPGNGFYPRPHKTPDFWQFYKSFGGNIFDARRGRLLLDAEALREFYQFFHDAVFVHEVTRKNHIGMSQERWYAEVASGQVGFWQGGGVKP